MLLKITRIASFFMLFFASFLNAVEKFHFATATDTEHYTWTLNLIASIHRFHDKQLGEIAVYDIGLLPKQRSHLNSLYCVNVYDVEKTNSYIFDKFTVNSNSKVARGWYSWKPVIIKLAMEKFSEFFYLDSGVALVGPMDKLFEHLHENNYIFIDCGHTIQRMTIQPLIKKFELDLPQNKWVLKEKGISAGIQGLSRALYASYVLPIYEMSHDIANFADDGSCPKGFGWSRHDQVLFSIQARLLGFYVNNAIRGAGVPVKNDRNDVMI